MEQARTRAASAPRQTLQRVRFGEYLCEQAIISDEQLLAALGDHWSNGGTIGSAIVRAGYLSVSEIEAHAARYHTLDIVEI
jgi:hypothetical protein